MEALGHAEIVSIFIGLGVLVLGAFGFYLNSSARYLSIREHNQYNDFILRELDKTSQRVSILEQTRPTTGEIEARLNGKAFQHQVIGG